MEFEFCLRIQLMLKFVSLHLLLLLIEDFCNFLFSVSWSMTVFLMPGQNIEFFIFNNYFYLLVVVVVVLVVVVEIFINN